MNVRSNKRKASEQASASTAETGPEIKRRIPTGAITQHAGPHPDNHGNTTARSFFHGQGVQNSGRDIAVGRDLIIGGFPGTDTTRRAMQHHYSDEDAGSRTTTNQPKNQAPGTSSHLTVEQRLQLRDSLSFEQIDARHMNIKSAHAKTCKWLKKMDAYLDWLSPSKYPDHHGFLWIKGKPGAGKSTLMKFALAQARRLMKGRLILSFFFNARGDSLEKTTAGMYRCLLLQLLENIPGLDDIFDSLRLTVWPRDGQVQWSVELLKDLFGQAVQSLGQSQVVCFIDALDECDEDQIRDMLSFFENIGELAIASNIRFQVCFSSRHYPHITLARGLELVLEGQEGHNQDIANYVDSELKIGHSKVAEEIKAELRAKASSVFMWVILVVDILNKEYDRGHIHALRKRLREIPADLHDLFRDILTRDARDRGTLILCIQWVLFARRPLRTEELYFAVLAGTDPGSLEPWDRELTTLDIIQKFILDSSKGLTEITRSGTLVVQFIHESVRDFLLKDNGLRKIWPDLGDRFHGQSHEQLKECCVKFTSNIVGTLHLPQPLPKASSEDAADLRRSTQSSYPFLEYTVRNVLYHAEEAESRGIDQSDFLRSFPLQSWVNLDNLFEKREARRRSSKASLLYVLAERNFADLIKAHFGTSSPLEPSRERYENPFFAALATGSTRAVLALAELELHGMGPSTSFHRLCQSYLDSPSQIPVLSRNFCPSRESNWIKLANQGELESTQVLLAAGRFNLVDPDAKDNGGRTPLRRSVANGHEAVVKLLLSTGQVDPDARDNDGWTPLWQAVANGHEAVVKLLLGTMGSRPSQRSIRALHYAPVTSLVVVCKYLFQATYIHIP
ncbi:Histone-lysine N-methyltransferase EHMT1 [Tolypocladium ophioglossoides CBS 100239]|uniref:Histone-lysine N-methyltransferase EHMT1 n=1 Tax=Tolypocladium ophioglossoides (strain CBS 100239) TaxID=1163406 RepID=A0A0L0NHR5_TOLOC|nr:Histone-lysine N-methyltransferase EHMT1 [Tolypocladium ophioglossoides CBS 100239]